jgi:hypothetical protein
VAFSSSVTPVKSLDNTKGHAPPADDGVFDGHTHGGVTYTGTAGAPSGDSYTHWCRGAADNTVVKHSDANISAVGGGATAMIGGTQLQLLGHGRPPSLAHKRPSKSSRK